MKKLLPYLIIALIIRIFLMGTAIHPDFRAVNLAGFFIAQKGETFSFYDHISKLPRNDKQVLLYGDNLFIYPPLAYLFHGVANLFLYPLYPKDAFTTLINDIGSLRSTSGAFLLLFLLKLPYLFIDLLGLSLIQKIFSPKNRFIGSILWLFNPVSLYVTYMQGQFDIIIAVLILASIVYPKVSAIIIGIAAGFKPFPIFLLPLLSGNKIKNIFLGLLTYLVIIAPYLHSAAFKEYALVATLSDKLIYAKIPVSGSQYLSLFFVGLFLIYIFNYLKKPTNPDPYYLAILLLFYSTSHFHPQWLMWVVGPLLLTFINLKKTRLIILMWLLCYLLIIFSFESSLHVGLFGYSYSFTTIFSKFYPSDQLVSIIRSGFFALSLAISIMSFTQTEDEKTPIEPVGTPRGILA